jgi:uncharacterized protein (UPF0548 family)
MNLGGIRYPRLSVADLDTLLEQAQRAPLTYPDVGISLSGQDFPTWRRHLGDGPEAFDHASDALRNWAPQRSIGARVHPMGTRLVEGATRLIVLRVGPVDVVAPVRVVAIVDEPDRFGYAYGTLPGHPERGEESFIVERSAAGVVATITVDARPGSLAARLARPVVELLQRRAIVAYLEALS